MNIYFIGSIRGGRSHQPTYALIVRVLKQHGTVSSQYVSDSALSEYGETRLTDREIFERERVALEKCDVVVADVTTPSLGVGYLIARATFLKKNVVALYNGEDTMRLSAMIKGSPEVEVHTYKTEEDIVRILKEALPSGLSWQ